MNQANSNTSSLALPFEKIPPARTSQTSKAKKPNLLAVMFNPGALLQEQLSTVKWPLALLIPGLAFLLFFMQTGLDQIKEGYFYSEDLLALAMFGLLYGTLGVIFISMVAWGGSRLFGGNSTITDAIRLFALAYSPTLIYVVLGIFANLMFDWRTAVAFGVTGVLWAIGPMIVSLRQMTAGKTAASVVLATVCGALSLLGWSILGGILG